MRPWLVAGAWLLLAALLPAAPALSGGAPAAAVDVRGPAYADASTGLPVTFVRSGGAVEWRWVEGFHSVTALDGAFDSDVQREGAEPYVVVFPGEGAHAYACVVHEWMRGVVSVG